MAGVAGFGAPRLSEVQAWDVTHLESAARDWSATAEHWEMSFSSIHRTSVSPGGTVWQGVAAEAAQARAFADLVKVRGLADVLHESAAIARRGAETLYFAKQSVLDAVREASDAGYVVSEDLSVTSPRGGVATQAQAQVYATHIQERAVQLATYDKQIAIQITNATAPLHAVTFAETPNTSMHSGIQMAGFGSPLPDDPTPPWQPPPPPYPQGRPAGPGLPPEGVRPPVEGPLTVGPPSRPSAQRDGELHLWDKNGGEWRYDDGQNPRHYPHWDYNPHAQKFDQWRNVGIDDLPTHREGLPPPRSGRIGPPPEGPAPPTPPAPPRPVGPAPRPPAAPPRPGPGGFGGGGIGGGGAGIPGLGVGGLHTPVEVAD